LKEKKEKRRRMRRYTFTPDFAMGFTTQKEDERELEEMMKKMKEYERI